MPRSGSANSVNHPVEKHESTDLFQTTDYGIENDIPIGMPHSEQSVHNVNTVVQPSITVQAVHRLKATRRV